MTDENEKPSIKPNSVFHAMSEQWRHEGWGRYSQVKDELVGKRLDYLSTEPRKEIIELYERAESERESKAFGKFGVTMFHIGLLLGVEDGSNKLTVTQFKQMGG
jgi:hypothetical protein